MVVLRSFILFEVTRGFGKICYQRFLSPFHQLKNQSSTIHCIWYQRDVCNKIIIWCDHSLLSKLGFKKNWNDKHRNESTTIMLSKFRLPPRCWSIKIYVCMASSLFLLLWCFWIIDVLNCSTEKNLKFTTKQHFNNLSACMSLKMERDGKVIPMKNKTAGDCK